MIPFHIQNGWELRKEITNHRVIARLFAIFNLSLASYRRTDSRSAVYYDGYVQWWSAYV